MGEVREKPLCSFENHCLLVFRVFPEGAKILVSFCSMKPLKSRSQWVGLWCIYYIYVVFIGIYTCLQSQWIYLDNVLTSFLKLLSNLVLSPLQYSILFSINQSLHLGLQKFLQSWIVIALASQKKLERHGLFVYLLDKWLNNTTIEKSCYYSFPWQFAVCLDIIEQSIHK